MRYSVVVALALAACAALSTTAMSAWAWAGGPSYRLVTLPSLGGAQYVSGVGIDDNGHVGGSSDLSGDVITRAVLWCGRTVKDLGTLGGANSTVAFAGHNDHFVVGVAETSSTNRLGESWSCSAFFVGPATHHTCLGFVWSHNHMRALPTLGGPDGFAAGANRPGQVVGWAENRRHDSTCSGDQVDQFRAVRWAAGTYAPTALRPLRADSTSAAVAINDLDQVVGISGACGTAIGGVSARHAVMWEADGTVHNLGRIGQPIWNTPVAVSNRGEVVGFDNVPGGATPTSFHPHAFKWTAHAGMTDLGTLPGDTLSEGLGVNDEGQIVGESCQDQFVDCRAVIWVHGRIHDLNALVMPGSATLVAANDINDAGQITGHLTEPGGSTRGFRASPVHSR